MLVAIAVSLLCAQELRVDGVAGRDGVPSPAVTLSLNVLRAMPQVQVPTKDRNGADRLYQGVLLAEILRKAGQPLGEDLRGSLLSRLVLAVAKDGYRVVFSLPELDPAFRENRTIVALRVNGKDLPAREGPFRIVVAGEKREARWLRTLERIEVMGSPEPMR